MKTLKKSLLIFFAVFTLMAVCCFGASAKTVSASGSCGKNVTYTYNSTTKELVISGTGAMTDYSSYNGSPFYDSDIKSVVIKEGVTTIGSYAFYSCDSLQSVTIGDSVTTISSYAFEGCYSLQSVTIGGSVTTIGERAFAWCDSLQSVTIGNSVTTIGNSAFSHCDSLQSVTIGNSVTTIGDHAFYYCTSLTSITIPDSVTTIGDRAFEDCSNLQSVTIGDGVTTIGNFAFRGCESLQSVTVDKNNKYYCSDDYGVLFDKNKTKLIQYPVGNKRTAYTIPDSVTTIGSDAFKFCDSLQNVTIGNSVTAIGDDAFFNCNSLQSVTIPDSVTTIGGWAFAYCDSLQSVIIPDSVTTIGYLAFSFCDSLQSVIIGNSVSTIGNDAFRNCNSLQSVTIPDSVTTIGERAFSSCNSLKDVYYTGTQTQWQNIAIGDLNSDLTGANIHYNHTHSYTSVVTTNPTCTKTGTKTYTCICGDTYTETISAKGHTYKTTTTKATTTKNGKTQTKCTVCGNVKSSKTLYAVTDFSLSKTKYVYTGNNKTPAVTVKDSKGNKLVKNTDYKLTVSSKRSGIGKHKVIVTLIGNYSGTKNLYFYILPNKVKNFKSSAQTSSTVTLKWDSVPGAVGYTVYRYSPSKKAYVKAGTTTGTSLKVSKLLTATKYTFKIVCYGTSSTGKGYNCDGYTLLKTATCTATPTISAKSTAKGKVALTWTNVSGETGYQVYYSTQKSSGYTKIGNYGANVTALNGSKLSSNYTYYFKVRAYIKTDSGYVYSPFSAVKGIKIK